MLSPPPAVCVRACVLIADAVYECWSYAGHVRAQGFAGFVTWLQFIRSEMYTDEELQRY